MKKWEIEKKWENTRSSGRIFDPNHYAGSWELFIPTPTYLYTQMNDMNEDSNHTCRMLNIAMEPENLITISKETRQHAPGS